MITELQAKMFNDPKMVKEYVQERDQYIAQLISEGISSQDAQYAWDEKYPQGIRDWSEEQGWHLETFEMQEMIDKINELVRMVNTLTDKSKTLKDVLEEGFLHDNKTTG